MSIEDADVAPMHKKGLSKLRQNDVEEALDCADMEAQAQKGWFTRTDITKDPKADDGFVIKNSSSEEVYAIVVTAPDSLYAEDETRKQTASVGTTVGGSLGASYGPATVELNAERREDRGLEVEEHLQRPPIEHTSTMEARTIFPRRSVLFLVGNARGRRRWVTFLFNYKPDTKTYSRVCDPVGMSAGHKYTLYDEVFKSPQNVEHGIPKEDAVDAALRRANAPDGRDRRHEAPAAAPSATPPSASSGSGAPSAAPPSTSSGSDA